MIMSDAENEKDDLYQIFFSLKKPKKPAPKGYGKLSRKSSIKDKSESEKK